MSIGKNIYVLRTAKNLSQGDLADMLDVSRQSVSKWETDAAVPDLDKLMKLCDVFEVSLDEITGREKTKAESNTSVKVEKRTSTVQKIIGYILFAFSLLLGLIVLLFGKNEGDYIILMPIALAILVCGLLCLFAGEKAFYWCLWTIFAPIVVLSPQLVGFPVLSTLTVILGFVIIIMLFIANVVFRRSFVKTTPRKTIFLIFAWLVPVALYVLHICLVTTTIPYIAYNALLSMALNFVCYVLIAGLETYTVCYVRSIKANKSR